MAFIAFLIMFPIQAFSQNSGNVSDEWLTSPGIIGTLVLLAIVLVLSIFILLIRMNSYFDRLKEKKIQQSRKALNEDIISMESDEIDQILESRKNALKYRLKGDELGSKNRVSDEKGLVQTVQSEPNKSFFEEKKKTRLSIETPAELKKIIIYYIGAAAFWLVFGTLVGEYLGLKFVWPELDHVSVAFFRKTTASAYQYGILGVGLPGYDWPWLFCDRPDIQ